MSQETIRKAVLTRFEAQWSGLPVARENQPFAQPKGEAWCRLSIQAASRANGSIGRGHVRDLGIIYLQVFLPDGTGTKDGRVAFDAFAAIFDNVTITTGGMQIQFDRAEFNTIGKTPEGLFQYNAFVAYRGDKMEGMDYSETPAGNASARQALLFMGLFPVAQ